MKTRWYQTSAVLVAACMLMTTACSSKGDSAKESDNSSGPVTLEMFSMPSNKSGVQTGWWAQILEKNIGIKLDLLPAGDQSEQKLQALMAGGELPDIVVFKSQKQVVDAVKANMLIDLDQYKDQLPDVYRNVPTSLQYYRDNASNGTGKAYAVSNKIGPGEVNDELNWGPFLRWDLYKKLESPKISKLEDYLPLLQKMQQLESKNKDGQKVYAFSLWKDWDGNVMQQATQPAILSGTDNGDQLGGLPFLEVKIGSGQTKSILSPDSEYIRALKFYYQANQMGLVDPDSLTQRFDTAMQKVEQGRILFAWWPWFAGAYNTKEHVDAAQPTGFRPILPEDYKAFWWGDDQIGSGWAFAISSKTKHLDAALKYLDYMYSADGLQELMSGPKGVTWDNNDKGQPYVTDKGWDIIDNHKDLPGGGKIEDGTSTVNSYGLSAATIDPKTKAPLGYGYWNSSKGHNPSQLMKDWQKTTGFKTTTDMLKSKHMYTLTTPAMKLVPPMPDDMTVLSQKIGDVVKNYSWLAVFAKNEQEFDKNIAEMQKKAEGLGLQQVLDWDNNAWKQAQETAKKYSK